MWRLANLAGATALAVWLIWRGRPAHDLYFALLLIVIVTGVVLAFRKRRQA